MNHFRSPKSTVVEMTQNHHQVSIIGCGSSSQDHPVVTRSFSSASNQWKERSSPEGRSCGDLEQEQKEAKYRDRAVSQGEITKLTIKQSF